MRVTSKGQVTIPKHIRQRTGIAPGAEVDFRDRNGEVVISQVPRPAASRRSDDAFEAYLDRVAGTMTLGMTTEAFMELLRGK